MTGSSGNGTGPGRSAVVVECQTPTYRDRQSNSAHPILAYQLMLSLWHIPVLPAEACDEQLDRPPPDIGPIHATLGPEADRRLAVSKIVDRAGT